MRIGIYEAEDLPSGSIIFECYEVIKLLGKGSTGVVYACRHRSDQKEETVALKILLDDGINKEEILKRFRNEIHISYRMSHPNVVRAIEYFRNGHLEGYTMEYIDGGDLISFFNQKKSIQIDEFVELFSKLCSAIQAVHDAGVVHRDIKPQNILIDSQGEAKISDFSTAFCCSKDKFYHDFGSFGTPEYMSPEVIHEGVADQRSDIFSLGTIAYQIVSGSLPYLLKPSKKGGSLKIWRRPKAPDLVNPACPYQLSRWILQAIHLDPRKRFESAEAMNRSLLSLDFSQKRPWNFFPQKQNVEQIAYLVS